MKTRDRTDCRLAVEALLQSATKPIKAGEISRTVGFAALPVNTALSALKAADQVHVAKVEGRTNYYLWGPAPKVEVHSYSSIPTESYKPRPIYTRPGSGDAFDLPSLHNGQLVDYCPPISIASPVQVRKFA